MKIHEYQAKEIFKRKFIPVPKGTVVSAITDNLITDEGLGFPLVVKAQVHVGGRGKAGAIRIVSNKEDLQKAVREILAMKIKGLSVTKVLIEQAINIERQFYLSITVDRSKQSNCLVVSAEGGIDIEETAKISPVKILNIALKDPQILDDDVLSKAISFLGLTAAADEAFTGVVKALFEIYLEIDAQLIEINPLAVTQNGKFIACDAKIIIDDNALFRHPELAGLKEEAEENELEKEAHLKNLAYVKLSGNIGIIGNGAGLVMATMDEVQRAGGAPANFLDIGGGAKKEVMQNALEILIKDQEVRGIFINVFGGITRCDEVAQGIIDATKERHLKMPIVLRLTGTQCQEGRRLLEKSNLMTASTMQEGAEKIVSLVRQ